MPCGHRCGALARRARCERTLSGPPGGRGAFARAQGADEVIDRTRTHVIAETKRLTGGRGVDVVFDSIGKATLRESFRATRKKGLVVAYGSVSGSVKDLDPIELGEAGSLFLTRPRLADHIQDAETTRRRAREIFAALIDGSLKIDVAGRYSLDDVGQAHAALEERRMIGKPVLVMDPR